MTAEHQPEATADDQAPKACLHPHQRKGGLRSAKVRAEKADQWRRPAEALAFEKRHAHPSTGCVKLAEYIRDRVPSAPRKEVTMETFIRRLEHRTDNPLPRSSRNPIEKAKTSTGHDRSV